jgi:hypothetical protein
MNSLEKSVLQNALITKLDTKKIAAYQKSLKLCVLQIKDPNRNTLNKTLKKFIIGNVTITFTTFQSDVPFRLLTKSNFSFK